MAMASLVVSFRYQIARREQLREESAALASMQQIDSEVPTSIAGMDLTHSKEAR